MLTCIETAMPIRFTPQSSNALTEMAGVATTFTGNVVDDTIFVITPASPLS